MDALIRQAGTKWPISQREKREKRTHGGKEEEKREKQNNNTFWKVRGGKKRQQARRQRLDTCNPCTQYDPFRRRQHGRATDAH